MSDGNGSIDNETPSKNPLSGNFLDLYEAFETQLKAAHQALATATAAWEKTPTDPKLTLKMQAAQGDVGNLSRGVGSLLSALVALQSEITQKIK